MYVLKIDFPTGVAYFTGKKRIVQGCESPGLTGSIEEARLFEAEEEALNFCKMLIRKFDMEFYCSSIDDSSENTADEEVDFVVELSEDIEREIASGNTN